MLKIFYYKVSKGAKSSLVSNLVQTCRLISIDNGMYTALTGLETERVLMCV